MKSPKKALTLLAVFLAAPIVACAAKEAVSSINSPVVPINVNNDIEEEYDLNEEFNVPSYNFEIEGTFVPATSHTLTFPRGASYTSDEFVLNQTGVYTLKYYLNHNGINYLETKTFIVRPYVASFSNEETSLYYGVDPRATKFKEPEDVPGLNISIAPNDVVTLNEAIDVNELSWDKPLFKGYIVPSTEGVSDMHYLFFKLSDVKDPSVYIKFRLIQYFYNDNDKRNPGMGYWSAGGNNQTCKGLDTNGSGNIHDEDWWGTVTATSFTATTKDGSVDYSSKPCKPSDRYFQINYDNNNKTIYAISTGNNWLVSELDSPTFFNDLWNGFPSGKARLSLYTEDNQTSENPTICLTEVHGVNLTSRKYDDILPPEIKINYGDYEKLPNAELNKPYPIPSATAYDEFDGETDVKATVWYNYSSSTPSVVKVKNGCFTPTKQGYYAIVYESKDTIGNIGQEVAYVIADSNVKPLSAVLEGTVSEAKIGDKVVLPDVVINGGVGTPTTEVDACKGASIVPVLNDGKRFSFTPDKTGKWLVTYTVTDYIGSVVEIKLVVDVKTNDKPVLSETPVISHNLVKGMEYNVPRVIAKKYNVDTPTYVNCDLVINSQTYKYGQKFKIESAGEVELEFKCGDASIYKQSVSVFEAYDVEGVIEFDKYFDFFDENVASNVDPYGVDFTKTGDINYEFKNPVFADNFNYRLIPSENSKNISNIKVSLVDFFDVSNVLEINVRVDQDKKKVYVSAAGGDELPFDLDLSKAAAKDETVLDFKLDYGILTFNAVTLQVGGDFEEFSSAYVILRTEITSIIQSASTSIKVRRVANNVFTKTKRDGTEPDSIVYGSYGGSYNINETYYSAPILVNDVLSNVESSSLTVTDPNGEVVTDINGVKLDGVDPSEGYLFDLTIIGNYTVTCSFSDSKSPFNVPASSGTMKYLIHCIDTTAPTITLTSTPMKQAKLGENVGLPTFTVTDNVSPADKLVIIRYIINPSGQFVMLEADKNGVKTTARGTYKWIIMAVDEYGNSSTTSGNIVVE